MATVCCPNCGRKIWLASIIVETPDQWVVFGRKKPLTLVRRRRWREKVRVKPVRNI